MMVQMVKEYARGVLLNRITIGAAQAEEDEGRPRLITIGAAQAEEGEGRLRLITIGAAQAEGGGEATIKLKRKSFETHCLNKLQHFFATSRARDIVYVHPSLHMCVSH